MDHVLFQSPEYRTVLTLTEKLVIAVKPDLVSLGNKMLSRHIIVEADHDIVTGTGSSMPEIARANHLITRIRECVVKDPQIFLKFVEILAEEPSNSTVAKELLETRNRLKEEESSNSAVAEELLETRNRLKEGSSTPPSITGVSLSTNTKCSQYHTFYIWFWLSVLVFVVAVIIGILQGFKHYRIYSLQVRYGKDMPTRMHERPCTVLVNATVYIGGGRAATEKEMLTVMAYDIQADTWSKLKPYFYKKFAMATVNESLVLIGGLDAQKHVTNALGMWDSHSESWIKPFPPMDTPCHSPTVISYNRTWLIVAGGNKRDRNELSRVEILDTIRLKWYTGAPLPTTMSYVTSAVVGNTLYLLGGYMNNLYLRRVFSVCLDQLISQAVSYQCTEGTPLYPWQTLPADAPFLFSTALAYEGALLAIGGEMTNGEESADIHMYQSIARTWVKIGEMKNKRSQCASVVLPCGNEIFITAGGGYYPSATAVISKVEILKGLLIHS